MAVNDRQQSYLDAMGIQVWRSRQNENDDVSEEVAVEPVLVVEKTTKPCTESAAPQEARNATVVDQVSYLDWPQLEQRVAACSDCELSKSRSQTVFGVGDKQADWMVIGAAPQAEDERQGEPFVGQAGQLLNKMLLAIGLKREQVFLTNLLKCRTPDDRDAALEELQQCQAYLHRQIQLLQPKIILVMGAVAAQQLLKSNELLDVMRGKQFVYNDSEIPIVATYHPGYLLNNPTVKRKAWQDLQFAQQLYAQSVRDEAPEK